MTTPAEFKAKFPEFVNYFDADIQAMLDFAGDIFNPTNFGKCGDRMLCLLAAHYLLVNGFQPDPSIPADPNDCGFKANGLVSTMADGDVAISFNRQGENAISTRGSSDVTSLFYATTTYGKQYLVLRKLKVGSIGITAVSGIRPKCCG